MRSENVKLFQFYFLNISRTRKRPFEDKSLSYCVIRVNTVKLLHPLRWGEKGGQVVT